MHGTREKLQMVENPFISFIACSSVSLCVLIVIGHVMFLIEKVNLLDDFSNLNLIWCQTKSFGWRQDFFSLIVKHTLKTLQGEDYRQLIAVTS